MTENFQNGKNTRTGFRKPEFQTHFCHDLSECPQKGCSERYIISFISLSLPSVTWLQCLFYSNAVSTRWCLVNRAGRWRLVNRAGTRQRWVRGHQKSYNQDNILKSQNQRKILRQTRYPIFKYSILSLGGKFVFHIWEIIRQTIIYYR